MVKDKISKNYILNWISEISRYAIPFLKNIKLMLPKTENKRPAPFKDPKYNKEFFLTKKEAEFRADLIFDVSYKVTCALSKGDTFPGCVVI